jgi:hypothetical protein
LTKEWKPNYHAHMVFEWTLSKFNTKTQNQKWKFPKFTQKQP